MKVLKHPHPATDLYPVDSDTITAWIQIGDHTKEKWRIRLKGIEGGELGTDEGTKGEDIVAALIRDKYHLAAHFHGNPKTLDKYGRHVGDIAFEDGSFMCAALKAFGHHWRKDRTGKETRNKKETING